MNGEMRGLNNTLDTINAAANAIASAGNRLPQSSSVQVYIFMFFCVCMYYVLSLIYFLLLDFSMFLSYDVGSYVSAVYLMS